MGIGVLIINEHNQLLLGKRKNAHGDSTWAPAGGHLEYGESFEECARREVYEETGLSIKELIIAGVTNDFFPEEGLHYVSVFLHARYEQEEPPVVREPYKIECWQWFDCHNLPSKDLLFTPLCNFLATFGTGFPEGQRLFPRLIA